MTAAPIHPPTPGSIPGNPVCPGTAVVAVERRSFARVDADFDWVAEEIPVSLEYNGIAHAVMLATPADLKDFALGFSLTEGIAATPADLRDIEVDILPRGIAVRIELAGQRFDLLKRRRRALAGRTGCGLCGTESLDQVVRGLPPVTAAATFRPAAMAEALARLRAGQHLLGKTGATHAAAWMDVGGHVALIREDVGRHNALDKLVGALARRGIDATAGAALVTSRASFEMVQKAASAGIGMLAAVSAPTLLAVQTAERLGVTLVGFARQDRSVVYAHGWRLKGAAS
ncbi:formate dehydrogenase accessory protein [Paramagnetospirillum caucaseum]|uniref:Sulfur carrier protein FdhD n=1 Tax=Paramagnetospirillum caucaseum TaxID=1244869 RepID=M3A7S6_9PROT|nr:formate dehydrogenase accessory sulfurtransferase FdhD [Paramagnetospirillum caucaseum]EME68524.1 formate dehydrogenase accessory protein [Paramagnetospirillum caucaseum]